MVRRHLHIETVFDALVIQILIRVQLIRLAIHFFRVRVDLLTHHIDQALRIQDSGRDLRSLQRGPDDFYLVLQFNNLRF